MWRLWALGASALVFLGLVVAALHLLQVDRDRAFARGHDAGRAEVVAAVARETEASRQASAAVLSTSEARVRELERERHGLQDQLAKLDQSVAATNLSGRLLSIAKLVVLNQILKK